MTQNSKVKRLARRYADEHGVSYMAALRAIKVEPHYVLTPPGTIEYVDADSRRYLPVPAEAGPGFMWGYHGTGPNTASWAILLDATGSCDRLLAIRFTDDNLSDEKLQDHAFVITRAEVRAWHEEIEPAVRDRENAGPRITRWNPSGAAERLAESERRVAAGPWWERRRRKEGPPQLTRDR